MSPEGLQAMLRRRPFIPFRLHLSDHVSYDIRVPELVVVGGSMTFIGIVRNVQSDLFDEPVIIANRHITRLEPLIEADTAK